MGADSVLVNAAFKEAATKYGGDVINMKPLYDSNVANMNKAFNTINSAMDIYSGKKELDRAGVRKQMAVFQKQADSLIQGVYAQDEPLPEAFVNAFREKIVSLQDDFELVNTYGKGDTSENSQARARIMGDLQRVTNQATNFRAGTEIALDNLRNIDPGSLNKHGISAHMQAFDFENYEQLVRDGKVKVIYGEKGIEIISKDYDTIINNIGTGEYSNEIGMDGNVVGSEITRQVESFTGDEVKITLASFNEKFPPVNLKSHVALNEDYKIAYDNAIAAGGKQGVDYSYNEQEYNALFTSHVDTEDKFKNFSTSKIKGVHEIKQSFKVSLENELNIPLAALQNMIVDIDGDGINDIDVILKELNIAGGVDIDAKDLAKGQGNAAFEKNLDALIDALTETAHPAFDISISAPILGAYLGKINENRYKAAFDKTRKASNISSGKSGNYTVNNREMSAETFERSYGPMVRMINNPQEGDVGSANGHHFIYKNGKYFTESTPGKFDVEKTQLEVATDSGLLNYTNVKALDLDNIDLESVEAETETEVVIQEIKEGEIVSTNLNLLGIGFETDIKKINGKFYKEEGYGEGKKFTKQVSAAELKRINKLYN